MKRVFSVVIPTYHRNDLLTKCLDCLAPGAQALSADEYEVIVTDDGSISTARELIRHRYPWVHWVAGPGTGPAANRNNGAGQAQGEWLVFTDDDCLPEPEFLSGYADAAKESAAQVLEGKTLPAGTRTRVDMECPVNENGGYLWSCNIAIRKDLFFDLGGFDLNFPGPAMEDTDLRTRLLKANKVIKFVPGALVLHPWRLKKGLAFWKLHSRSRVYFANKHPEMADSISLISLGLDLTRILVKQIPRIAWTHRGRGLVRELFLTFYTTCAVIAYSKASN
jgi:GT2 family glycosyltransferase